MTSGNRRDKAVTADAVRVAIVNYMVTEAESLFVCIRLLIHTHTHIYIYIYIYIYIIVKYHFLQFFTLIVVLKQWKCKYVFKIYFKLL